MSLSQVPSILRARWRSALAAFAAVLGLAIAFTLWLPSQYTATAAVVLDVKSPAPSARVGLPGMTVYSYMGTQVDVLQSERVVLQAMRAFQADKRPSLRAAWQEQTVGR